MPYARVVGSLRRQMEHAPASPCPRRFVFLDHLSIDNNTHIVHRNILGTGATRRFGHVGEVTAVAPILEDGYAAWHRLFSTIDHRDLPGCHAMVCLHMSIDEIKQVLMVRAEVELIVIHQASETQALFQ